jgi:dolichyl-phosphate-mannose-protein mannosyltransferase
VAGGEAGQIPENNDGHPKGQPAEAAGISGAPPPPGQRVLSREERVEYRDQDGNLLDPEQVKALEGKVEFKTRYETRTRVVDENGNELPMPEGGWPQPFGGAAVVPPHPDVEGANPATKAGDGAIRYDDPIPQQPQDAESSQDGAVEAERAKAQPASDVNEATAEA